MTIEWTTLSQPAQWTAQNIAYPISLGYTEREIAQHHGLTTRSVNQRLEQLRNEILNP